MHLKNSIIKISLNEFFLKKKSFFYKNRDGIIIVKKAINKVKIRKIVRKILGPDLLIFTPGIRMNEDNKNDQKRVCTPSESIKNGADKIIMGRSLIKGNIEENINKVSNSIKE